MKLGDPLHPICARREERGSEMQRTRLLTKTGARHDTDARRVQQLMAVELVWTSSGVLRSLHSLLGELDLGEEVHTTLWRLALHTLHFLEGFVECLRPGS